MKIELRGLGDDHLDPFAQNLREPRKERVPPQRSVAQVPPASTERRWQTLWAVMGEKLCKLSATSMRATEAFSRRRIPRRCERTVCAANCAARKSCGKAGSRKAVAPHGMSLAFIGRSFR